MSAGTMLRTVLGLALPGVHDAAGALWASPRLRERYPAYLAVMHGLVRSSVPLMRVAAEGCAPVAPLAEYLRGHIEEERDHDRWLLEDLAVLGVGHPDALLPPALREEIAELAGAQYYWVRHLHPACLLGYMAVLEGCPPSADLVARLPARTGWPAAAFRTVASHCEADPGHLRDLIRLTDRLPLTPEVSVGVARNAGYTAMRAARLLRSLA
jgi:Iron-containing redox enzyme